MMALHKQTFYRLLLQRESIRVKHVPLSVWFNNSSSPNGVKNHKDQMHHPLKRAGKVSLFALNIHQIKLFSPYTTEAENINK